MIAQRYLYDISSRSKADSAVKVVQAVAGVAKPSCFIPAAELSCFVPATELSCFVPAAELSCYVHAAKLSCFSPTMFLVFELKGSS
ncbi:hypothetical protein TNCV_1226631 [Trichonephila clavipes]|nr:hypothetical protein TNCV_1226631 [Trichonephila clavipes]